MQEKEKHRMVHLIILLCYTAMTVVLTIESSLLGWEMGPMILLIIGLIVCWGIHLMGNLADEYKLWVYLVLSMCAYFYYGIHETSMYDLALVAVATMVGFSVAEKAAVINACMFTYYFTMIYDFIFVVNDSMEWDVLLITRTMLHFGMVYLGGRLVKIQFRRRSRERRLMDAKVAKLEDENRRTEEFLTNVSHELRTPINAVTGITAVMIKNEENPEKRKDIHSIQNAGRRLFSQIDDILDFTEIETGRITLVEEPYMISSLITDLIIADRMREVENGAELIFDIEASMPSVLLGDARKIKKIIKHLVDNGIKFTKKGGVYVRIYAARKPYGVNLCIKVSDTGIGINKEHIKRIADKFYQSNNGSNRRSGGLGLGLSIVHGMTAAMGGFVQIESEEGRGTTVTISIPQGVVDDTPSMSVENREELCLACFLRPEKYEVPEVRDYYNMSISHLVRELDLRLYRVSNIDELMHLASLYHLTHIYVGKEEYLENQAYLEKTDANVEIIVIAENGFELPQNSKVKLIRKPFYCMSLVNVLNTQVADEEEELQDRDMRCPGLEVLVVDDEPMNLMVAEGIFKGYQMKVTTVESGMQAVELCRERDFDLIFLDHMMPELDGVETLRLLRKIPKEMEKKLTVIAFTANAVSGARDMFRREGFDEFVPKPVEKMELERVLRKVLPKSAIVYGDEAEQAAGKLGRDSAENQHGIKGNGLVWLEDVGIHVSSGLNYCGGDEAFYRELLTKYAQESKHKEEILNDFLAEGDVNNYRIQVHALKSTSKMVGADKLSEMAKQAEEAAKRGDLGYIREHHEELMELFHVIIQYIQKALGSVAEEKNTESNLPEIAAEELIEKLQELKEGLDTFEIDKAEAVIADVSATRYQGTPVEKMLEEVKQDVENFEMAVASEKVEVIIRQLAGGDE